MKRLFIFIAALLLTAVFASAQEKAAYAEVEYSIGRDIVVIRDGRSLPIKDIIGLQLMEGDQIQTGKRTFLEMRLMPSGGLLKLSENTVFVLESLSSQTKRGFRLVYGRVRAKVDKLASTESFDINSDSVSAGVRGTDFGYDVIVPQAKGADAGKPVTRVYCFDGSVLVTIEPTETSEAREFLVESGNMVAIRQEAEEWIPELTPLTDDIKSFWKQNDFSAETAEGKAPAASSPTMTLPSYASVQAGLKVKNAAIFGGIVLVGLGSVLQGVGAYAYNAGDPLLGLNAIAGGAFIGLLALPVLVFGLSNNPVAAQP